MSTVWVSPTDGLLREVSPAAADWAKGGRTDADKLHFACGCDHTDASSGKQQTVITDTGRLGWTDGTTPPQINHAHRPEELLRGDPDPPADQVA